MANRYTIAVLGSHSALDVCRGAKDLGFKTLVVVQKGRDKTYAKYYKTQSGSPSVGCVDEVIELEKFADIIKPEIQEELLKRNCIFIPHRSFEVYINDYDAIEKKFKVPMFGNRFLLRCEERGVKPNQYDLLDKANIRYPKQFNPPAGGPKDIDRLCIVKVLEKERGFERAFFFAESFEEYKIGVTQGLGLGKFTEAQIKGAIIEEFIVGVQGELWVQSLPLILKTFVSPPDTWQRLIFPHFPEGILLGVSVPSEKFVYACGINGLITRSTNGGDTFPIAKVPTTKNLNAISFLDNSRGFVVGDSGTILYTENGGVSPEVITEFVPYGLQDNVITSLTAEESDYSDEFSFFNSDYIFAGTNEDGVFRKSITSTNDFQDWANIGLEGKSVTALTVQHWGVGPMDGLRLYAAVKPDSTDVDSTLLFSRETTNSFDTNWVALDSGINKNANSINALKSYYYTGHTAPTDILAGTNFGIFRRTWGEDFWTQSKIEDNPFPPEQPVINSIDVNPHWAFLSNKISWAAGSFGLSPVAFYSTDGGNNWKMFILTLIEAEAASSIAINTRNPDSVYVSLDGEILLTPDNGNTWTSVFTPPAQIVKLNAIAVDRLHPENI
ncbi:MAG: hypothetical protein UT04_C0036G0007, partial [Candidatus Daviesbacteria bacterium GW2011_GWF2_38_7]